MLAVEMWRMLNGMAWMWPTMAGFLLMILAGVTSYKKARAKMSYETWWIIHVYSNVAIAASFMHQELNGQMFVGHSLNRLYWTSLYILMATAIVVFRFGIPLVRSVQLNLVVDKVIIEGPGVTSVLMRGRKLRGLAAEGGQFIGWRFLTRGHFLMSHPYSLSAAPTEKYLPITVKDLGDHSRSLSVVELGLAVDKVEEFFYKVDMEFSTYKSDSEVSRIRRGELEVAASSDDVKKVWQLCEHARELTLGAFDPWKVAGGFDPSGLVKGWDADVAAKMLVVAGVESVLINAAGDLVLRGGQISEGDEVKPWNIGISSPDDVNQIAKTFELVDGSVATCGDYEKGAHIVDPHTGLIAIGSRSASVVGPDGALCDALATALMVDGRDAQRWMGRSELAEYCFWVINRDEETAWSYGPNKGH